MKKVLFVCVENACRSQMTEAFFIEDHSGKSLNKYREVRDIIKGKIEELVKGIT